MSQHDSSFYKPFIWVLGALVVFTFLIAILANMFSPASDRAGDPLVMEGVKKQIAPIGQSRVEPASEDDAAATAATADDTEGETTETAETAETETAEADTTAAETENAEAEKPAAEPAQETVAEVSEDPVAKNSTAAAAVTASTAAVAATAAVVGSDSTTDTDTATDATDAALNAEIPVKVRAVVATNCAGCHQEGVKGAQRTDDAAAWSALASKGLDTLTASVINGKGEMMPRAETSLSDEELGLAVQHMIAKAVGDGAGAAPAATEGNSDTDASAAVEVEAKPAAEVEVAIENTTETATETESTSSATISTAATTTTAAATATSEAASVLPANVKTVVDTLCAGCHISGVANAPKFGDKAAWDERMAMGMDKLLASSIAGKGAMPARGGSQLSDAELQLAIQYMATR